jgi:hypothetical protein
MQFDSNLSLFNVIYFLRYGLGFSQIQMGCLLVWPLVSSTSCNQSELGLFGCNSL